MKEYIVMKSKYKENRQYINMLTFSPIKKSDRGIYRHYHLGKLVWEEEASDKLFNDVMDDTFYHIYDFEEQEETYPIFKRYRETRC